MTDYESTAQSRATSAFMANECTVQAEKAIGQACSSYVLVGRQVQSELIANAEMAQFDQEAMLAVSNMTDDQLALAAMAITVLAEYDYERINNDQLVSNIYVDCLLDVIGVNDVISLIGTAVGTFAGGGGSLYAIIEGTVHADAKTMGKIFYKMAKRYAGWLGVGYMLLEYGQCINAHRA